MGRRLALGVLGFLGLSLIHTASAAVGRTAGQFGVSPTGAATYSIPLWVPPGVRGLTPSLALTYNSHSGDGLLGVGWGLAGLSAISRCNLTFAQDTAVGSPQLTASDRFCLDGNRLRTTNGSTYGAVGATYQTEIANFSNVISNGTLGTGPAWFKVQGKDGLTYEYGNTTDSAILAPGSSSALVWALNAVRDRFGNAMTFTYTNDTTNGSYRPASIQYTFTGSSTTNNGYSVVFTYQSRAASDQLWKYAVGGVNNQLNYLSSVTVNTVSGSTLTMVHGYTLTYATAPSSSRLRISDVQECASSFTDCFPATTINYQNGQTGWAAEIANAGNATNMAYALPLDVNGDGIDDLVYPDPTSGHWYYELGAPGGTFAGPYDTGLANTNYQSALAIDFNATGKKSVLVPNASGNWRVMSFASAGAAFSYVDTTTSAAGVVPGSAMVGDIDGDGREDLIYAVSGGSGYAQSDYIYYRLNVGGGFSTTQGTLATFSNGATCAPCVKLGNSAPFGNPGYRFTSQARKIDFNGDGKADLLVYLGSCNPSSRPAQCGQTGSPIIYSWNIFLSQPNGAYVAADVVPYSVGSTPNQPPLAADFNGDGCTDIAYTVSSSWDIQYGTCGRAGTSTVLAAPVVTGVAYYNAPALAMDWDGDGRADIVEPGSGSSPDWGVARSTGNTLGAWTDLGIPTEGASAVQVADINGDGQPDMVYMVSNALKSRLHSGAGQPPDLASSIIDAYGNSVSPTYLPLTQQTNYFVWNDQVFPYKNYLGPLYEVNVVTFSDPSSTTGGTYLLDYYYAGAATNLQGRGFSGFGNVQSYDSRSGIWETRGYSRAFPTTGMLSSDQRDLNNTSAQNISTVTNTLTYSTLDGTANNERYFPYASTQAVNNYEVGSHIGTLISSTSTSYSYDGYGNATTIASAVTDEDANSPYYTEQWTSSTVSTITADTSANWCLSMPTEVDVTRSAPGAPSITRHVALTPDYANCRETGKTIEPNSSTYKVTESYGFDSFGNINGDTVTGVGMSARTLGITWNAAGQFPAVIKNSLNQSITMGFDPATGMKTSQTDLNYTTANPLMTSWKYDEFGRKTLETRPDKTSTSWSYSLCTGCDPLPRMVVTEQALDSASHVISTTTYYSDALDRSLYRTDTLLSGSAVYSVAHYYDSLGRVVKESFPYLTSASSPGYQTYLYDTLNRVTQVQRPISGSNSTLQTTTIAYSGRTTTTTDADNHVSTKINQVTGALGRSMDANGYYQTMAYDAFGSLLTVTDSAANTLFSATYAYGINAFQTSTTDIDRGAWTFTLDALGELTAYKDAKAQSFSITYDALSRPLVRTEPDMTTTWTWGNSAASYNIGKLQSVSSTTALPAYTESYTYDSLTRLSVKSIAIPDDLTYSYTYTYNATTGLLDTLTYPAIASPAYQLKLQYGYANGILQSINDASSGVAYWKANTVNPRGQVTQATLGNGIVINRGFDAVTGWQGTSQAGSGGGTALQNNAYLFDYVGNVTQRQDNNQGLTENFYYDAVNRLSYSALDGTTNLTMGYDLLGNITSRSDINSGVAWTYDPVHKHQVTSAGTGYAFTYDPNGNMVTGRGGTISWYSYNLPYVISNSAGTAQFYYGPSHQFYEEVDNGPVTTIYIGGLLQKKFISSGYTEYRHLIKADGALIEVDKTTGTNSDTYYITQDHIGSSSVVTNSAAAVLVDESFGAWGARRGSNWTGSPSTPDNNAIANTTNIGFTGQTMLDSVKMIHMNGRVYDRVIGRFLSADPTIPDPGNTQSFNRYSYVVNSPLTFVDPSGFCYTGGYAKCLPYGSGHSDRNNLVGPADSSRSISGSGFGEGAIGNYSFYGMTTDASDWYTAGDVPVTFTYSVDFGDSSSSSGTDSIGDSASQSFSGGGIRGATFCWLGPISGAKSDV